MLFSLPKNLRVYLSPKGTPLSRPHYNVGHHVWLSQEKLFVTDLGQTILIFAAKCRVIQWYKWFNGQEIEF